MAGWYRWLEDKLAPTEEAANFVLIGLIVVTLVVIAQPSRSVKALWAAYLISP